MQYNDPVYTKAIVYGKNSEPKAYDAVWFKYLNLKILWLPNAGLNINHKFPYFGASPDGVTYCSCHGKGLLECPFSYRAGLMGICNIKTAQ